MSHLDLMFRRVNPTVFLILRKKKKNCAGFEKAKLYKRNLNYGANEQILSLKVVIDMGCKRTTDDKIVRIRIVWYNKPNE